MLVEVIDAIVLDRETVFGLFDLDPDDLGFKPEPNNTDDAHLDDTSSSRIVTTIIAG